ncbi:winged helix-turn-helix domain-containing protein [Citrobacter amalonaticus]|nr:winged helix-turn-helix domain-containing protein [Citrobacter amalonaticus]
MILYLINGTVEFNPQTRSLKNQLTGGVVYLQQPATACFLYLIVNQGRVVAQKELVGEGWKARDVVTLPNTFYQTILTLRKALEEIGLPRDMVKTISRQGLTLSSTIVVEPIPLQNMAGSESAAIKTVSIEKRIIRKYANEKLPLARYWERLFLCCDVNQLHFHVSKSIENAIPGLCGTTH